MAGSAVNSRMQQLSAELQTSRQADDAADAVIKYINVIETCYCSLSPVVCHSGTMRVMSGLGTVSALLHLGRCTPGDNLVKELLYVSPGSWGCWG